MKIKKKTAVMASFLAGALLFTTTAVADIADKSGYEQFKEAIKSTTANCTESFDNYQVDFSYVLKDNGTELCYENGVQKYDRINNRAENEGLYKSSNGQTRSNYYYSDQNMTLSKSNDSEVYYINEYADKNNLATEIEDPFKQKEAEDIEKIADAVVGNLKDYVLVEEKTDGSKEFSGSLQETQIPTLVNAVVSLQTKTMNQNSNEELMPRLTSDIYVKEVTGNATANKDGVIEKLTATGVLSGTDENGQAHELTLEILVKLSGINATAISAPDLTGKKVERNKVNKNGSVSVKDEPQKYLGKYSNDIVIEKDNKFVKIGQRTIAITDINQQSITGTFSESYRPGFEEYASRATSEFSFTANFTDDKNHPTAQYEASGKDGSQIQGDIFFDTGSGKCYFNIFKNMNNNYDSQYNMVLD